MSDRSPRTDLGIQRLETEVLLGAQPHVQSKDCWCNPTVEVVEGQDVLMHDAPGLGNPPISYSQEEYDAVVAERDQARMYEKHTAVKLVALRGAVGRYLRYMHSGKYENDDDSALSLLDDIEKAMGS